MTSTYKDCDLYVNAHGQPQQMTFMKVTAQSESPATEIEVESQVISSESESVTYLGQNEDGTSLFKFQRGDFT